MTDAPREDLVSWIRDEQSILWDDLHKALRSAIDGVWSIKAGNVARRIAKAARMVGPTPHREISYSLVAGGVYEAVLTAAGVAPDLPPDEEEWRRLDVLMAKHGTTREICQPAWAATVAEIGSERERNWISGAEDE